MQAIERGSTQHLPASAGVTDRTCGGGAARRIGGDRRLFHGQRKLVAVFFYG